MKYRDAPLLAGLLLIFTHTQVDDDGNTHAEVMRRCHSSELVSRSTPPSISNTARLETILRPGDHHIFDAIIFRESRQ